MGRVGRLYYNAKLDRMIDLRNTGISGPGMTHFVQDEIEFGGRAAMALDEVDQSWWILHDNVLIDKMDLYVIDEEPGGDLMLQTCGL